MPIAYMVHFDQGVDVDYKIRRKVLKLAERSVIAFLFQEEVPTLVNSLNIRYFHKVSPEYPNSVYVKDNPVDCAFRMRVAYPEQLLLYAIEYLKNFEREAHDFDDVYERFKRARGRPIERVLSVFEGSPGKANLQRRIREIDPGKDVYGIAGRRPNQDRLSMLMHKAEEKQRELGYGDDIAVLGGFFANACVAYAARVLKDRYDLRVDLSLTEFYQRFRSDAMLVGLSQRLDDEKMEQIFLSGAKEHYSCMLEKYRRSVDRIYFTNPLPRAVSDAERASYSFAYEWHQTLSHKKEPGRGWCLHWLEDHRKDIFKRQLGLLTDIAGRKGIGIEVTHSSYDLLK